MIILYRRSTRENKAFPSHCVLGFNTLQPDYTYGDWLSIACHVPILRGLGKSKLGRALAEMP